MNVGGVGGGTSAVEMNPVLPPLLTSLSSNNTTITQPISLQTLCLRQSLFYSFLFNIPPRVIIYSYRNKDNKIHFHRSSSLVLPLCGWIQTLRRREQTEEPGQESCAVGGSGALGGLSKAQTIFYFSLSSPGGYT